MPKAEPLALVIDAETLGLVLDALGTEARRKQRAATIAAGELEGDVKTGKVTADQRRAPAVRISRVLADAYALERFATELKAAVESSGKDELAVRRAKKDHPATVAAKRAAAARSKDDPATEPPEVPEGQRTVEEAIAEMGDENGKGQELKTTAEQVSTVKQGEGPTPIAEDAPKGELDDVIALSEEGADASD